MKNKSKFSKVLKILLVFIAFLGVFFTIRGAQKINIKTKDTSTENQIEYLNNQIDDLNAVISLKNSTIEEQNGTISSQASAIETKDATIASQADTISSQSSTISTQSTRINTLESELSSEYNYQYSIDVDFYVDSELYMSGKARNGGTILIAPTEPTKSGYTFTGWSLTENGTVVDLTNTTITQNTSFYAIFELASISFTIDGTTYYAEDGMTWREWVDSEYNGGVFEVSDFYYDEIAYSGHGNVLGVYADDLISAGVDYTSSPMAYCFVAGTKVLTSVNGNSENIENLNVGDDVVSLNVFTNEMYIAKIKFIKVTENVSNIVKVTLANGITIEMTEGHPLLCRDAFKTICDENENNKLKVGDEVYTINGYSEIVSIEYLTITTTVYNLNVIDFDEVDDNDTYDNFFANGICVHNIDEEPVPEDPPFGPYEYQQLP